MGTQAPLLWRLPPLRGPPPELAALCWARGRHRLLRLADTLPGVKIRRAALPGTPEACPIPTCFTAPASALQLGPASCHSGTAEPGLAGHKHGPHKLSVLSACVSGVSPRADTCGWHPGRRHLQGGLATSGQLRERQAAAALQRPLPVLHTRGLGCRREAPHLPGAPWPAGDRGPAGSYAGFPVKPSSRTRLGYCRLNPPSPRSRSEIQRL